MATDYYQDDEDKKKKRGGQGNKGRQPGMTGAPKKSPPSKKSPSNGGSTPATTSKTSNGGWSAADSQGKSDILLKAADFATTLGKNLGNHHKYKNVASWSQGDVKDEVKQPGMDITKFSNAYGSRNADNTGVDMGDLKAKDLELTPEEKRKLNQYNSYNVG